METQWNFSHCKYLQQDLWEMENLEQVQELRLPDGMGDIGRVLGVWGQPMVRSKEWRGDSVRIGGGVTAWVLYAPEDGTAPQCAEIWLPFQSKHKLAQTQRDGVLRVQCYLRSMDARTVSSRKLMVRASVGLFVEALESTQQNIYQMPNHEEDLQLLEKQYPVMLPVEAGEKQIPIETDIPCPQEKPCQIVFCMVYPEMMETQIIGMRAVLRGSCQIRLLYQDNNGDLKQRTVEMPFAQYVDLEQEYDEGVELEVMLAVSSLESQITDEGIHVQGTLVGQYVLQAQQRLTVVEDAYSPVREVKPKQTQLQLPALLDRQQFALSADFTMPEGVGGIMDISFFPDQPTQYQDETGIHTLCCGNFQILYTDQAGNLQSHTHTWSGEWTLAADLDCDAKVILESVSPSANFGSVQLRMCAKFSGGKEIPMVSGLQIGESTARNEDRPSMLLQRMGAGTLWELAKATGSTVDAIKEVNHLTQEACPGQMLLIPLL